MSSNRRFSSARMKVTAALRNFEKEAIAKVRSFVKFPTPEERKRLSNERILASLKRIGVASRAEVDALSARVERLELSLQLRENQNRMYPAYIDPKISELEN